MTIFYSLIAYKETILCDSGDNKDFGEVIIKILSKIPPNNSKLSYAFDQYLFHYSCENQVTCLCLSNEDSGRRVPFLFLNEINDQFKTKYSTTNLSTLPSYGLMEFSKSLQQLLNKYNNNEDQFDKVKQDITGVKNIMVENIDKVLERGERMDILVNKTDNLNQTSLDFRKKSTALRRSMWWKNIKLMTILAISGLFFFYVLICMWCGFPAWSSC